MTDDGDTDDPPFIVIEGLDGAGTTTQCERLVEHLRALEIPVTSTREPSDGPIGALIRQMLSGRIGVRAAGDAIRSVDPDALALLFAADRIDHIDAEIEPALEAGRTVVSDRYYHSSYAYQGDEGVSFDTTWVETLNERARTPDLTIFLRAPAETCLERLAARDRRDLFENADELERLEQRYDQVIEQCRAAGERVEIVDATGSVEAVHRAVLESVGALDALEIERAPSSGPGS